MTTSAERRPVVDAPDLDPTWRRTQRSSTEWRCRLGLEVLLGKWRLAGVDCEASVRLGGQREWPREKPSPRDPPVLPRGKLFVVVVYRW